MFGFFRARRAEQEKRRKCAGGTGGKGEGQDGGWNEGSAGESKRLGSAGSRKVRGKDGEVWRRKKCRTRKENGGKGRARGEKRRKINGEGSRREYKDGKKKSFGQPGDRKKREGNKVNFAGGKGVGSREGRAGK